VKFLPFLLPGFSLRRQGMSSRGQRSYTLKKLAVKIALGLKIHSQIVKSEPLL